MFKYLFVLIFALTTLSANFNEEKAHKELRGILVGLEEAINSENYGNLANYFHNDLKITTINQEVITSKEGIRDYFDRWFGKNGYLKKLDIKLVADEKTKFYSNYTVGVVKGYGEENYILSDSRKFNMKTRWSATLINDNGEWKILTLHIGTNFLDNPLLTLAEKSSKYFGFAGVAAGVLLGLIIGFLIWRRKE